MNQDALLRVQRQRSHQYKPLEVASFSNEVLQRVAMRNSDDVLRDNRPLVQLFRHIVAGGADNFHAALISLTIGVAAYESGQKGMVNINDPVWVGVDDLP